MNKINVHFPEILFAPNAASANTLKTIDTARELEAQKLLNAELLRICQMQKKLLDEQGKMIVEMLEEMGK